MKQLNRVCFEQVDDDWGVLWDEAAAAGKGSSSHGISKSLGWKNGENSIDNRRRASMVSSGVIWKHICLDRKYWSRAFSKHWSSYNNGDYYHMAWKIKRGESLAWGGMTHRDLSGASGKLASKAEKAMTNGKNHGWGERDIVSKKDF